jgi:hypothetical protein
MDKKLKIHYFGCSFTALENSITGHEFTNYRHIIDKQLGTISTNLSYTGKSNQHIFDDVYNHSKEIKKEMDYKHLFVIQTTFNDRLGLPCDIEDKFVSLCKTQNPENYIEEIQIKFYNDWLKYFYSRANSFKEFQKQMDFVGCYLDMNQIGYIFIGVDESLDFLKDDTIFRRHKFLSFGETNSFYKFATLNKLRIVDIPETQTLGQMDYHFNKEGHETLASKILNEIKNTYFF